MSKKNGNSNGRARLDDGKVRVAIVGVGNCANSLLQGCEYYKDADDDKFVPGLMHVNLGGYHIRDIEFTAAFDVVKGKVGEDLADAMWAHPNDTIKFADVPKTGIKVSRGMTHDGLGKYISQVVEKAPGKTDDIVGILKETKTDVVVSYLPVGSEAAAKWYAEQCLEAGVALVNCMPVFIAREDYWNKRFEDKGLPIIGDDIKSQVGATITHRVLTSLFRERGVHLDKTMQLNVGGNSDFLNMLERERLESKKISKTNAVTSMLDYDLGAGNVHVGPSDYVPWLTDRKWAYIRMEGSAFGDVPLNVELKLEVWDSPNSAGIVIDAVRLAKLALNNGVAGSLVGPSSYLMKSPPRADRRRRGVQPHREVHREEPPQGTGQGADHRRLILAGTVVPRSTRPGVRPRGVSRSDGVPPLLHSETGMALRVALVTPFSWSQPHDVNEHVAGLAGELRARDHSVTVLAPSNRPRDLAEGRRALARGADAELIALGPAIPIARGTRLGVPVGVRANLSVALARGAFDVVHGFEPGLPSLSYLALRDSTRADRRDVLLAGAARLSPGPRAARAPPRAARRTARDERGDRGGGGASASRADTSSCRRGVDLELFAPAAKRNVVVLEWRQAERPLLRALVRELADADRLGARAPADANARRTPHAPRALRGRVHVRTALDAVSRAAVLRDAAVFVPAFDGFPRVALEAQAAGAAVSAPAGRAHQPELAAAEAARLIEDDVFRAQRSEDGREAARLESFGALADRVEQVYTSLEQRRRPAARPAPLEERDWIVVDLHMHTTWSHDCSIEVDDLLDHAEAEGLGAIAVTDHNVFGGALEAVEKARGRKLIVIPGEEVKTDDQGEVIGLFLKEEIPRGMTFAETVAAIRAQGGLVYIPHPFDRLHAIPDAATLQRHLGEIDVFEVYNARLLFEGYNDEALRFARKYNLIDGRRIGRARAPGRRHRGRPDAPFPGPGGVPPLAPERRDSAPPEVPRVPPGAQVGRPSQGKGALGANIAGAPVTVATDEIYEKYLQKAITEINALGDEVRTGRRRHARPRRRLGTPARRRLPAEARAPRVGAPGGRRVLRTGRQRAAQVAAAAAGRPDGDLRDELPQVRRRGRGGVAAVPAPRAPHRAAEAHRRDGRAGARVPRTASQFPLASEIEPTTAELQRFTPTIEALVTPDIDESLDEAPAKTAFWNAFKLLGTWWAELPPY